MKRYLRVLGCILMVCMCSPVLGVAQTQEEWDLSCEYKIRTSTAVYSTPATSDRDKMESYYVSTLSANTYVKKKHWAPPWQEVRWMSNGTIQSGYVWGDDIVRCVSDVSIEINGEQHITPVSELDPNHDALVDSNHVWKVAPSVIESNPDAYANVTYITPDSYIDQAIMNAKTPQEKWELSCSKKTISEATVYKLGTEEGQDEVLLTIPASTYFKPIDNTNEWQLIEFMIDGTKYRGKIPMGEFADTKTQVTGKYGLPDQVHELDPRYEALVKGKLPHTNEMQTGTTVSLLELGTVTSKVSHQGETIDVSSAELVFAEDVPEDKKMAVVYAPKTGKASLRKSASENAAVIKQCKAGTIVAVLETGKTFTKINYNGTMGYILTGCLQFCAPVTETQGNALISYKGKTNGSTTVNIRNQADKGSAKVAIWKTGTAVILLSHADGWYEVEAKGIRGFVMEEFVTLKD